MVIGKTPFNDVFQKVATLGLNMINIKKDTWSSTLNKKNDENDSLLKNHLTLTLPQQLSNISRSNNKILKHQKVYTILCTIYLYIKS